MKLFAAFFVVVAVPLAANSLNINLGLGFDGLTNLVNNLIPNLNLGLPVDLLIDSSLVYDILHRPFDAIHALTDCGVLNNPTVALSRNGLSSTNTRWYESSDGTWFVPIVMDSRFTTDETNVIYSGMINIQQKTCMKFYIYNEADLQGYDYVKIIRGSGEGCYSDSIGRANKGRQIINLQPMEPSGCIIAGIAAHELLHAIGFDHEQCTPGRDNYVTIMRSNIATAAQHNFDEDSASTFTSFGAPYDYGSVMHYGAYAFSTNGQKTIITKDSSAQIGQRQSISDWDAYKVKKMHGCAA